MKNLSQVHTKFSSQVPGRALVNVSLERSIKRIWEKITGSKKSCTSIEISGAAFLQQPSSTSFRVLSFFLPSSLYQWMKIQPSLDTTWAKFLKFQITSFRLKWKQSRLLKLSNEAEFQGYIFQQKKLLRYSDTVGVVTYQIRPCDACRKTGWVECAHRTFRLGEQSWRRYVISYWCCNFSNSRR